jgi:Protein of unknown function (DUF669)
MTEASDQLSDPFDPTKEEGSPELTLIPKGTYVARVADAVIKPYKTGRGQAVYLTWELMDEKYQGRKVWEQYTLSHENETAMKLGRQRFKDICDACGLTQSFRDLTLLYDKPCTIWVRIEEDRDGRYPPKNRVGRVKAITAKSAIGAGENKAAFNDEVPF